MQDIEDRFIADWDSLVCPVCQAGKWPRSPFCRRCSIRLHRMKMFAGWKSWTGHSIAAMKRKKSGYFENWIKWYDRCRDFLLVTTKRGKNALVLDDGRT